MSGFDVKGALKEGYTRAQIVDHLAKQNGYDANAARAEGYTDDAILRHLVGAPQVVEDKENPALFGMVGGGLGAAYGVGDTGIRVAHGSFTKRIEDAAEKSAKKLAETFADDMASRRAANPLVPASGSGDAVTNWTKQMHSGAHHGGRDFSEAHEIASKLKAAEKADPRFRAVQGSPILLDTRTADQVNAARGAAPVVPPKAPPTRTPILQNPAVKIPFRAASLTGQLTAPAAGMASSGYGAAQAINRLQEGTSPRDKVAGAVNVLGAASGLGSLAHNPKIKYPATAISGALNWLSNLIATDKNEFAEPEQKATGGAIQGYNKGKKVVADKVIEGALSLLGRKPAHTAADDVKKLSDVAQGHIGKFYVPTQADRMGGVGGPSYSANQLLYPEYSGMAWGSGQSGTATGLARLAKDPNFGGPEGQLFAPLLGAENMHQSNQMVFDELMKNFYKNRKALTPEMRKAINDYMQTGGTITGKKAGFEGYPGFDIADKSMIQDLGQTFEARKQIAQHAFGGQGIGGRKAQIIPYEEILRKTRDPLTEGAETFSMGPRAFKLTGETHPTPRPDLNPAYPFQLYGSDIGAAYTPVPSELSLMDFQRGWRQNTGKTMPLKSGKLPQPGYYEHTLGYTPAGSSERIYPRQQITEDWIKELQRSGFKEGGLAHLAVGGQPIKMFQQLYRGYAGKPGAEEIFASPQKRVAEYYAQKRAAQTGLQPGVEAVQVDPFAGKQYGHALPIDQFNQDVVTTQARKLSPLDVLTPKPNRMTEFELSMAEQIDQMRQAKKAQDARLAEYYRQKAGQHTVEPRPAQDLGRSVAELAEFMESKYK